MNKYLFFITSILLIAISSCDSIGIVSEQQSTLGQTFPVRFTAEHMNKVATKTSLVDTTLTWENNDKIGIFVSEGIQNNMCFRHIGDGIFYGEFATRGISHNNAIFCSYYPWNSTNSFTGTMISSVLKDKQTAPFDSSIDFIVADTVITEYNEIKMPAVTFRYNNHLFSIIKVTLTNSDPSLMGEHLYGIELLSKGGVLAGYFSTELSDGKNAMPVFGELLQDRISVDFPENERPLLGKDTTHTIYAIVAPGKLNSLKLTIKTENYKTSITSSQELTLAKSSVTTLPTVDISALKKEKRIRTMGFWGDSLCSSDLCSYLQGLLGADWIVYRCGVAGNSALGIAGLQGGIPMCIGASDSFTLPANHLQRVKFGGLYSTLDGKGNDNKGKYQVSNAWWFKSGYEPRINPCIISFENNQGNLVEVECEISYNQNTNQHYIQRTTDGEAITVPSLATVTSYGAIALRNTDVTACYMGVNGHPQDTLLSIWYDRMIDYSISDKFIVAGYHRYNFGSNNYWTQTYHDLFVGKYGDLFLDLRLVGNKNADRLLIESGTYNSLVQKSQADIHNIENGEWPAAWYIDFETNVHPNVFGYRAYAIMMYEKMRELGYLD